ncbi:MAG: DMT family transporter [Burkholderiaceae bacterium]|jgi:drug/metabolite transporter (DMT)-like permease
MSAERPSPEPAPTARFDHTHPVLRAMLWATAGGIILCLLNAVSRGLTHEMDPAQVMFLRYLAGFALMVPFALRAGRTRWRTGDLPGHLLRGLIHTIALTMWFIALPTVSLADTTAIGFTTPIFLMLGAGLLLGETMMAARWIAAAIGFAGVLIVVGPSLGGSSGGAMLLLLASAPMFAATMLMSKRLARRDGPSVLVLWQAASITLLSAPLAIYQWQPVTLSQALLILLAGVLGNVGQYAVTRSFHRTDISATQSVRFLDLLWASLFGWMFFSDVPAHTTLAGGAVILASSLWIARRESRAARP